MTLRQKFPGNSWSKHARHPGHINCSVGNEQSEIIHKENYAMENNYTGIPQSEGHQPPWSPAGNSGLSVEDKPGISECEAMQGSGTPSAGAPEYKEKIMDAVTQAKDYLGEKAGVVGDKIKEFATDDLSGMATKAKDFARQNPGQAILISAGAGLLLGLIVRGRR
jgi:ElaB/YqjD/DUF883 family membrane-anchored ribosome-binding protein